MKYYLAFKEKNKILPFMTTWMALEGMMLSEINQAQEGKSFTIAITQGI